LTFSLLYLSNFLGSIHFSLRFFRLKAAGYPQQACFLYGLMLELCSLRARNVGDIVDNKVLSAL